MTTRVCVCARIRCITRHTRFAQILLLTNKDRWVAFPIIRISLDIGKEKSRRMTLLVSRTHFYRLQLSNSSAIRMIGCDHKLMVYVIDMYRS
jgi:hypothetical protein